MKTINALFKLNCCASASCQQALRARRQSTATTICFYIKWHNILIITLSDLAKYNYYWLLLLLLLLRASSVNWLPLCWINSSLLSAEGWSLLLVSADVLLRTYVLTTADDDDAACFCWWVASYLLNYYNINKSVNIIQFHCLQIR